MVAAAPLTSVGYLEISSQLDVPRDLQRRLTARYMDDVERMADWLVSQLTDLGVKSEKRDIGTHELAGKQVKLPSVVIGQIGNDPKKVCCGFLY